MTSLPESDFSQFLLSPTGRVEINLPNGEPMLFKGRRVAAVIHSPASAEYARAQATVMRAARDRIASNKTTSEADDFEEDARFLVAITANLENFPYPGGIDAVYRERRLGYIGDQIRAHIRDQGNFFAGSRPS
jgi:hypothetical protein